MNTNHEIWEVKTVKSALHCSWIVQILNFEIWLIHLTDLRLKMFSVFFHFSFQNQAASLTDKAAGGARARSYCSKLLQETTEEEEAATRF